MFSQPIVDTWNRWIELMAGTSYTLDNRLCYSHEDKRASPYGMLLLAIVETRPEDESRIVKRIVEQVKISKSLYGFPMQATEHLIGFGTTGWIVVKKDGYPCLNCVKSVYDSASPISMQFFLNRQLAKVKITPPIGLFHDTWVPMKSMPSWKECVHHAETMFISMIISGGSG